MLNSSTRCVNVVRSGAFYWDIALQAGRSLVRFQYCVIGIILPDSASNRNKYQGCLSALMTIGPKGWNLGFSNPFKPQGLSRPVQELLYPYLYTVLRRRVKPQLWEGYELIYIKQHKPVRRLQTGPYFQWKNLPFTNGGHSATRNSGKIKFRSLLNKSRALELLSTLEADVSKPQTGNINIWHPGTVQFFFSCFL